MRGEELMLQRKNVLVFLLVIILAVSVGCQPKDNGKYVDGTYSGTGEGKGGSIKVEVAVEKGKVKEIKVAEHSETPGLSDPVFDKIITSIIEKQSTEVDVVSGGTVTSEGIKAAVEDALKGAVK